MFGKIHEKLDFILGELTKSDSELRMSYEAERKVHADRVIELQNQQNELINSMNQLKAEIDSLNGIKQAIEAANEMRMMQLDETFNQAMIYYTKAVNGLELVTKGNGHSDLGSITPDSTLSGGVSTN